jgi:hypothetical protein
MSLINYPSDILDFKMALNDSVVSLFILIYLI